MVQNPLRTSGERCRIPGRGLGLGPQERVSHELISRMWALSSLLESFDTDINLKLYLK